MSLPLLASPMRGIASCFVSLLFIHSLFKFLSVFNLTGELLMHISILQPVLC